MECVEEEKCDDQIHHVHDNFVEDMKFKLQPIKKLRSWVFAKIGETRISIELIICYMFVVKYFQSIRREQNPNQCRKPLR